MATAKYSIIALASFCLDQPRGTQTPAFVTGPPSLCNGIVRAS
jgi:hypothetical protein